MTFEEKAIAYYKYALELEEDDYGGITFTPSEFFENLEEEQDPPGYQNEAFKWSLNG